MSHRKSLSTIRPMITGLCTSLIAAVALAAEPGMQSAPASPVAATTVIPGTPAQQAQAQAQLQALEQQRQAAHRQMREARREREQMRTQFQRQQNEEQQARRQLREARQKLEAAAQQVAALSARLAEPAIKRAISNLQIITNPRQGLIGVQLDNSGGTAGARVRAVSPGGAAERAGVRAGDLIVAVNGTDVRGPNPARRVVRLMRNVKPGGKVTLRVLRNGTTRHFTVIAQPGLLRAFFGPEFLPPMPPRAPHFGTFGFSPWRGPMLLTGPLSDMELAKLTPQLGRYFGTDTGVLVVRAPPHGALGLRDGDVILSIGDRSPTDSSQVIRILDSYDPGQKITLQVMRMHRKIEIATMLPAAATPHKAV